MTKIVLFTSTALTKALEGGQRWITIRPHGPDSKGQPVLIQPQPDGSAKVIGGAGGSLNHLRLNGIKSDSEYASTLRDRARERRDADKARRDRDKQNGVYEAKAKAHERVTEQRRRAQRDFVSGVAKAMGWDESAVKFDEDSVSHLSEPAAAKVRQEHEKTLLRRAQAAVKLNRERLVVDAQARAEANIGEVPLDADSPDQLSVQDLDPARGPTAGLGYSTDYKERAEAQGATAEEIKEEAQQYRPEMSEAQRQAAIKRGELSSMVGNEMKALRDGNDMDKLAPKLVDAKAALELMKMDKKRKLAEQQARDARRDIDKSTEEPKAYVIEVDDAKVDAKVASDIANDLRTISTRSFLSEVAKVADDPQQALGRHIGSGAFNSINSLALAAGGAGLVDRSVVDVLGVAGAAEVLARRLHKDLTPGELADVTEGMTDFHLNHYMETSREAIAQARELQKQAQEIELSEAMNGGDLAAMSEINQRRADALNESQKVLGTALGEMEANAALVYALGRGATDKSFDVSLGRVPVESAIQQVRAIGLQRGDYTLETADGNRILKITPEGMNRLAAPVNRADLEQVKRNMDIVSGRFDEDNWLPNGISDRPDLDLKPQPGVAPSFAVPFKMGDDMDADLREYIGSRAADGDAAADIVSDLQSAEFIEKVGWGRAEAYRDALNRVAPLMDDGGKLRPAEALSSEFEGMADSFVADRGLSRSPMHRQSFAVDDVANEALHRALADEPTGVAAYKQVGDLTPQDQKALRDHFFSKIAKPSPEAQTMRDQLHDMRGQEPEREVEDMFGDKGVNPDWSDWKARTDSLSQKINDMSINWPKYVETMGGAERAYRAIQDTVKSQVSRKFADAYNTLNPGKALKVGRTVISDNLNHLDAVDPKARDARREKERAMTDTLRNRVGGKYASGSVRDKLDSAREQEAGESAAQMSFFADEPAPAEDKPLGADERWTIGHEAERQIAGMMPVVGKNFKPGQPVKMFRPEMSGGKNAPRQRAIKMLEANKKVVLSFGVGSGKTLIGIGGFTHLHSKGAVKRGLFLAPSIAQGNFGADALRFVEPGKYQWHCEPGASRDKRIAAYKDPAHHFCVMTHQSFRDDMLHLGAKQAGVPEEEMASRLGEMSRGERQDWLRGVMRGEGIAFDYLNVDEGHDTLNRRGKTNSTLANVVDAMGDNASHYVSASADPIKNDVSEAFSLLQKMDPARYTDENAFMRKYGVDTMAAKDGLRRELARFQYPSKIDPDITAAKSERSVKLSDGQKAALGELDKHMAAMRIARMQGKVDVAAAKAMSPQSFEGVPGDQHEAIAKDLQSNIGILKTTATRALLDGAPDSAKIDAVMEEARARPGKQGIVFAHSLKAVENIRKRLEAEGVAVEIITGKDTAKDKAGKVSRFNPATGKSDISVMVCSDAGAVGANLQSGQWLVQYDTPDTAKTHAQRAGRINRVGQKQNVDLIDLVSDHPDEKRARDRLAKKYALRDMMTTPMESLDDTGVAYYLRRRQVESEQGSLF